MCEKQKAFWIEFAFNPDAISVLILEKPWRKLQSKCEKLQVKLRINRESTHGRPLRDHEAINSILYK